MDTLNKGYTLSGNNDQKQATKFNEDQLDISYHFMQAVFLSLASIWLELK